MSFVLVEDVARKLGGQSVLGTIVRFQADLALVVRNRLLELGGETPLTFARTETGARVIETILGKIAWGAAA